jgi:ribokinase
MSKIEAVGLGAINMDHLYRVERILDDGEAVVIEAESSPGGSAANTIYGLAKLGVSTGVMGVVGDDAEGSISIQDLEKVGVDTSRIRVKAGAKTGSVLCLSERLGRRSLYVAPGANNQLTMDDLDLSYVNQAGILHLSSFADDRQFRVLLELVGRLEPSVGVSFAPGMLHSTKMLPALSPILARTRVLFLNHHELRHMTGKDVIAGAESCLKQGCQIVAVTLGGGMKLELGKRAINATSYIRDADNEYAVEASGQNTVADATGAGDAFAAGFLYGLLKDKGLEECGRLGDIVARFSLGQIGAREGLPTAKELAQSYRGLYPE